MKKITLDFDFFNTIDAMNYNWNSFIVEPERYSPDIFTFIISALRSKDEKNIALGVMIIQKLGLGAGKNDRKNYQSLIDPLGEILELKNEQLGQRALYAIWICLQHGARITFDKTVLYPWIKEEKGKLRYNDTSAQSRAIQLLIQIMNKQKREDNIMILEEFPEMYTSDHILEVPDIIYFIESALNSNDEKRLEAGFSIIGLCDYNFLKRSPKILKILMEVLSRKRVDGTEGSRMIEGIPVRSIAFKKLLPLFIEDKEDELKILLKNPGNEDLQDIFFEEVIKNDLFEIYRTFPFASFLAAGIKSKHRATVSNALRLTWQLIINGKDVSDVIHLLGSDATQILVAYYLQDRDYKKAKELFFDIHSPSRIEAYRGLLMLFDELAQEEFPKLRINIRDFILLPSIKNKLIRDIPDFKKKDFVRTALARFVSFYSSDRSENLSPDHENLYINDGARNTDLVLVDMDSIINRMSHSDSKCVDESKSRQLICFHPYSGRHIVPVAFSVSKKKPKLEEELWDHIVETSIKINSGLFKIQGGLPGDPEIGAKVKKGTYRVRIYFGNLIKKGFDADEGNDIYFVSIWPAPMDDLTVIKQWSGFKNRK